MTSFAELRRTSVHLCAALLLTSCSGDAPAEPTQADVRCDGVATSVRRLAPFEHVIFTGAQVNCMALAGDDREYLVVPQLTGAALPYGGYGFRLGDPNTLTARIATQVSDEPIWLQQVAAPPGPQPPADAQSRLDARMRQREAEAVAVVPAGASRPSMSLRVLPAAVVGSMRRFSVLNTLDAVPAYTPVNATLRFAGSRVLLYVDTLAQSAFTESELLGLGRLYDERLAPAVLSAFGNGSDIDLNERVIFVLTPVVNAMVSTTQCTAGGFVRGFFYNHDLRSTEPTSNRGEVFYGYVPDPAARWSCAHSKADVTANLPPTFMHELQHMVSYGEHAIERNGGAEEVWLNEGLSHMAEEIGSLVYETRFPAPSGRTMPTSIFPDSASPYINPNLLYSYRFLLSSATYSLTSCAPGTFCSLAERGGVWLLLRWMADQRAAADFRPFVETNLTGRANLEAVTGQSMAAMLGTFALAVSVDSVSGVARAAVPPALRFQSRNLRRLYRSLFDAFGIVGGVGRPFPIEPLALTSAAGVTGTMRPGTFLTYRLRLGTGAPPAVLQLRAVDGTPFPGTSGAQVSVVRLP